MSGAAMPVELHPATIDAIARRVVEMQRESASASAVPTLGSGEMLTAAEARAYVKRRSTSAFGRWCHEWGVRPYRRGRYSRSQLDLALGREARRRAA